jgi:deoxyhypusine synthase
MTAQRKSKSSKFLTAPTRPVSVDRDRSITGLLEKMEGAGFGARQLAEAHRIWLDALGDNTTIYIAATGNLIPAGMRRLLAYVIKNRFVDVLVVSGEMLFHDLHETLGRNHYQAHAAMDDEELDTANIVRMGDTLGNADEYREADEWIGGFANQLEPSRPYSVREFLHFLGKELAEIATEDGLITSAYKARIPIFCPDLGNSEICVGIAQGRFEKKNTVLFDLAQDSLEMMQIAQKSRSTCLISLGGVDGHSYIKLSDTSLNIIRAQPRGHKYAVTICSEPPCVVSPRPHGSLSEMTQFFGKTMKNALTAYVQCDATIALPIIITSLSQTAAKYMKGRKRPTFTFVGRELLIEVS